MRHQGSVLETTVTDMASEDKPRGSQIISGWLRNLMTSFSFGELPMKQLMLAAVAATLVFASAAQAAAPASQSSDQAANAAMAMSAEDCAKAMADCAKDKDPAACKKALEEKGCKAEG